MAYDYAVVHLKYTISLAAVLTLILRPLLTRLDLLKTAALCTVAFVATVPWDSYLIHNGIWTYPPDAIIGPRLFAIPIEELFFFIIQTYITAMLYTLLNKPTFHPQFLTNEASASTRMRQGRAAGQFFLAICIAVGAFLVVKGGQGTYLGLILMWACPFLLLTWTFSGYFLFNLPTVCIATPIIAPTIYLWVVDELALGRGTWAIESGTKLGWCLWGSLEIEEATFFLVTNVLIVFGMVAFDRGLAVLTTFPELVPGSTPNNIRPLDVVRAIVVDPARYDMERIIGLQEAVCTLRRKSRSFYLASSVFSGRLRTDLILLYSFCRVADDLVDDAQSQAEALNWITKLTGYLDLAYSKKSEAGSAGGKLESYIESEFPPAARSALQLLPTHLLPSGPLYELLEGFKMDLCFTNQDGAGKSSEFPIDNEKLLELYAHRVASTVGELCLWLVFHHSDRVVPDETKTTLVQAAQTMGHALQYVNIARDIKVDAQIGRVYIPNNWLKENNVVPTDIVKNPDQPLAEQLRQRLLNLAFEEYANSRTDMNMLPDDVRGPLIVAVESYMEIGRVLREKTGVMSKTKPGRATVPRSRRIWVAWKGLSNA
ncbi:Phytoene synthase [Microdochium bolleyi]|uniref:Bifunctional lycopene cyclase/phytoene synthase n=1 Tax=Microdochium bolleyi TaxID=196109 RepID=A0A136JAJ3_9PEZI|nr:Phytoene synthase [Microdochium bolleyi]